MEIRLNQQASDDLNHLKKNGNEQVLKRIRRLLESISATPFAGIGKPEPLRFELTGKWSRRITRPGNIGWFIKSKETLSKSIL